MREYLISILFGFLLVSFYKPFILVYDLRIYEPTSTTLVERILFLEALSYTNSYYKEAGIQFRIDTIIKKDFPTIEELSIDAFDEYYNLIVDENPDRLSVWITKNVEDMCIISPNSISCRYLAGFANINPLAINNIVLAQSSLYRRVPMAHELGHYFGLKHTFADGGDDIEDTPLDPGSAYQIFVSYERCEMFYKDYKPMINNIMAYYSPCIDKDYKFTKQQHERIRDVAYERRRNQSYKSH